MTTSMTGFASRSGQGCGFSWNWDIRSFNAKGLDLRLRLPDWISGLEQDLRGLLTERLKRGSVSLTLRVARDEAEERWRVDERQLNHWIAACKHAESLSAEAGLGISPITAAELLDLRGVMVQDTAEDAAEDLRAALVADFPALLEEFAAMRAREGAALSGIITKQLDDVERLISEAVEMSEARRSKSAEALKAALSRVVETIDSVDEARIAQELALIAVKADITEELDRLGAHVAAARELVAAEGEVGRKLDFLMQEFNREANTLCSKSQYAPLTALGLDLKVTIDQMREQIQNVE